MPNNICEYLLAKDIDIDCENPIVKGIESNGVIMNRKDIDFTQVEFDAARKNVIKTLALLPGKKAYSIYVPGPTPFNNTTTTMEVGANRSTFTNDVAFAIMNNDPDVCEKIIDQLANGEFVVLYENKFKNINKPATPGDSAYQIAGYYQGLKATKLENNKWSDETEGGWSVVLQETKSPRSGLFLYDTNYQTTKLSVQSLLNPAQTP